MQDSAIVINEEKVSLPNNVKKIPATNNVKKVPVTNNVKKVSVTENKKIVPLTDNVKKVPVTENKKIVPLTDNEKKVPFTEKKNISIVYVHGFRGGKNTFWDFPELLKKSMKTYNVEVNNKIFDAFETKGEFDIIVNKIIDWIYEKADNEPIVLMGHSMGGILVSDVFRKIMKGSIEKYKESTYKPNIIGVFGFDSPYFGLTTSAYGSGLRKIGETVSAVSNIVSNYFSSNDDTTTQTANSPKRASEANNQNNNNNKKSGWGLGNIVLGAAALGYMIYNNENAREAVRDQSNKLLAESTEYINDYKEFLEPLLDTNEQCARIDDLIKYIKDSTVNGKEQFIFKNYYPVTIVKTENGLIKQNFIYLPTEKNYLKFFDAINGAKNSVDVIYSHTNMFKSETNAENVQKLANKCSDDLYQHIKNIV
ncbi:hypothetical protein LY90DRAFT_672020 [Neocallimastix californiae]|jgi:hypothetical protein|uniref:DUF676 domain-containing protein n=1 Tax=Neocallimastix californiae TaxID=1754190 RepID=A0A1Y2C399_9FUNG|nr:hypothetical protein LY90DRAFT_672020 [Neocallimastix californiae]|eukprot:ORY41471.1 hypothetical protein LY90DRAFT_672020 [Neocallimastix californiae]